ncbi:MAG: hypothetical protein ABJA32_10575, partial [Ginsengibacter sp.]|jgi:hypothetical protein
MKKLNARSMIVLSGIVMIFFALNGCKKSPVNDKYNLDVQLYGSSKNVARGFIAFRQDPAKPKIITLDTYVQHLQANHEYLLQRAVDPINVVDGNCTSTAWLTLGLGLTPQSIITDNQGNGHQKLWRDLSSLASGSDFDIHFQVIDAVTNDVVLSSNCFEYILR